MDLPGETAPSEKREKSVKHPYHGPKFFQDFIEDLVQQTSTMETLGCLIFSHALLLAYQRSPLALPPAFFNQGCVLAAFRAARDLTSPVLYQEPNGIITRYLQEAQQFTREVVLFQLLRQSDVPLENVPHAIKVISNHATGDLRLISASLQLPIIGTGFSNLINTLAARYHTAFINNMWMHMEKRQRRAVSRAVFAHFPKSTCSDSYRNFLTNFVIWRISGSAKGPETARYKCPRVKAISLDSYVPPESIVEIINNHRSQLITTGLPCDEKFGYFTISTIKAFPERFWPHMVFLSYPLRFLKVAPQPVGPVLESIIRRQDVLPIWEYADDEKKFQLIPQLKMKVRSIKIGKKELAEILSYMVKKPDQYPELPGFVESVQPLSSFPTKRDYQLGLIQRYEAKIANKEESIAKTSARLLKEKKPETKAKIEIRLKKEKIQLGNFKRQHLKHSTSNPSSSKHRTTLAKVSLKEWEECFKVMSRNLFPPPYKKDSDVWTGVIDTDAISMTHHMARPGRPPPLRLIPSNGFDKVSEPNPIVDGAVEVLSPPSLVEIQAPWLQNPIVHEAVRVLGTPTLAEQRASWMLNMTPQQQAAYFKRVTEPTSSLPCLLPSPATPILPSSTQVFDKSLNLWTQVTAHIDFGALKAIKTIPVHTLGRVCQESKPIYYGTHGKDVLIEPHGALNIIGVDPGHAILLAVTRELASGPFEVPPITDPHPSKAKIRAYVRDRKLAEQGRNQFNLTTKEWYRWTGRAERNRKEYRLRKKMNLKPIYDYLSENSSKTVDVDVYCRHIRAVILTLPNLQERCRAKSPRRWNFECYRLEQLAAKKLSDVLLEGCTGPSVVIWGNGGFGPTSRGHPSAPNKRLRRLLSKYCHIMLSSEWRSSQRSACCHAKMQDRPSRHRTTVKQCLKCRRLLARDGSASCIILDTFKYQRQNQTTDLPPWLLDNKDAATTSNAEATSATATATASNVDATASNVANAPADVADAENTETPLERAIREANAYFIERRRQLAPLKQVIHPS